ncbi:MAG: thioredoxin family protein [Dehalococcoidia bacterium]
MIKIKVFGSSPPCAKCKEVEKRANKVAGKYPGQVEVSKLDAISEEGQKYNVFFTPTVVIEDRVVSAGEVISESEMEKAVQREMDA